MKLLPHELDAIRAHRDKALLAGETQSTMNITALLDHIAALEAEQRAYGEEILDTIGWYASENYHGAHARWQQAWQSAGEVCEIANEMIGQPETGGAA